MFTAGGALCLFGQLTDRWIGELIGLPFVMTIFAVYAVVAFALAVPSPHQFRHVAGGLFLLAVAVYLLARWLQVWAVCSIAVKVRREMQTDPADRC